MAADLIFDLDGTLVDSLGDLTRALNAALRDVGAPEIEAARARRLIGGGVRRLVERALPADRRGETERALGRFTEHYEAGLMRSTVLYPEVRETLSRLASHRMAVVTNKPERFARRILTDLGLTDFFAPIVGGDTVSVRKPDPAVLAPVFAAWGGPDPADVWIIGDGDADITVGKNAGIRTLAVTYGFRDRRELEALSPDAIVDEFSAIADVVG